MNVATVFGDVLDLVIESDACPCVTLSHVTDNEAYPECMDEAMAILHGIVQHSSPDDLSRNVGHFLTVLVALGYALGAGDAYDITLQSEVCVPDSLASLDFIGEGLGDKGTPQE